MAYPGFQHGVRRWGGCGEVPQGVRLPIGDGSGEPPPQKIFITFG